jgi:hypothetical protein
MADVIELIEQDHRAVERVFEQLRSGSGERRQLLIQLEELLLPHAKAEEQAVYPTMQQADLPSFDRREADEEHLEAEDLLMRLEAQIDDDTSFRSTLEALIEAVNHHVEEEEREALPELRQRCDAGTLTKLGERFETAKAGFLEAVHDGRSNRHRGELPTTDGGTTTTTDLLDLTKEELYEKAKALDIDGRSKMNKQQLAKAVAAGR